MSRLLAIAVTLFVLMGFSSCGGGKRAATAVQVGAVRIEVPLVEHWTSRIAHGGVLFNPVVQSAQTPKEQALRFLIWSAWVRGESLAHGAAVSESSVERAQRIQEAGFPTKGEYESFLKTGRETSADARLEIRTDLAAASLHRIATSGEPMAAPAEALSYYEHHKPQFALDEERFFEIVNHLSLPAAQRLVGAVKRKHRFPGATFHESLTHSHFVHTTPGKRAIERSIFAAGPHAVGGPVKLFGFYSVFLITKISPPKMQPFAAVRGGIERRMVAEARKRAFSAFAKAWVARWKAKTNCRPGFLVEMCSQSPATPDLEAPLLSAADAAEVAADAPLGH